MRFPLALALASLAASAAANDYEFDMFYPSPPATGCAGEAEHIADSGDKGCLGYFRHGAASSWRLSNLKDGCVVNFYGDKNCQDKLDWIDGKSPKGECKTIPNYTAARTFSVTCS